MANEDLDKYIKGQGKTINKVITYILFFYILFLFIGVLYYRPTFYELTAFYYEPINRIIFSKKIVESDPLKQLGECTPTLIPGEMSIYFKYFVSIKDIRNFVVNHNLDIYPNSISSTKHLSEFGDSREAANNKLKFYIDELTKREVLIGECEDIYFYETVSGGFSANTDCNLSEQIPISDLKTRFDDAYINGRTFGEWSLNDISFRVPKGSEQQVIQDLSKYPEVSQVFQGAEGCVLD